MVFPEGTNRDLVSVTLHCERPSIADITVFLHENIKVVAIIKTNQLSPRYAGYSLTPFELELIQEHPP